jgi:membrane protease YdiL (CAAX protease family)
MARLRGKSAWRDLVAWQPWSPTNASRSFWFIVAAAILYSLAANIALARFHPESRAWFSLPQDPLAIAGLFLLAAVLAPAVEELLFRGWIYTNLRAKLWFRPTLLLTSALFAFLHYEDTHLYALAVFPVGLALGAIREREGSVKASMSFHAAYNFTASVLTFFNIA